MSSVTGIFTNNSKVIETEELSKLLYSFCILLDHRGQAGAGVVTANTKRIKEPLKGRGPARGSVPFSQLRNISDHTTFAGIAHNCYGKDRFLERENIHPVPVDSRTHDMYVVSDGILLDKNKRREALKDAGYKFISNTNGAVIGTTLAKYLDDGADEFEAGRNLIEDTYGAGGFSAVFLLRNRNTNKTKVVAVRDKTALKPLCCGEAYDTFFVVSESYPLKQFGVEEIQNVNGGDVVVFSDNGKEVKKFGDHKLEKKCIFEQIYFGGPEALAFLKLGPKFSDYAKRLGVEVDSGYIPTNLFVRSCLGLAWTDRWKNGLPEPDIISPIVDSGRGVTDGIGVGYNKRVSEALVKTLAYRTFQIPNLEERFLEVLLKFKLIIDQIKGNKIVVGDDSIVKGGVSGRSEYAESLKKETVFFPRSKYGAIMQLKNIGDAEKIIMAISYAPMYFQCPYGFEDMEHLAAQDSIGKPLIDVCNDVSKLLEPDWEERQVLDVRYNPLGNVYDVCGKGHCAGCASGCYSVDESFVPDVIKRRRELLVDAE